MQVRVVPIAPADEVPQLSAVAVLGLFRTRAGALLQESLQKELVPPEHGTGLSGIEEAADVRQGLRLIDARENGGNVGNSFGNTLIFWCCRKCRVVSVEGAFQPPWVNWVIRLTSPHLP